MFLHVLACAQDCADIGLHQTAPARHPHMPVHLVLFDHCALSLRAVDKSRSLEAGLTRDLRLLL